MARSALLAIAAKELQENVHSRRFQIALALATLLMVTSVVAHSISYQEDRAAYQQAQQNQEQSSQQGRFKVGAGDPVGDEIAKVLRQPHPLSVFVSGPGDGFARTARVNTGGPGGAGDGSSSTSAGSGSPTNQRFPVLDLGFVAGVVVTLMAVLFAYDAISGERERGTLKVVLANPVPRDTVLLGKYLGGMASVLLPFAISLVVALAVFQFTGVRLSGDEWGRLGLIVLLVVPLGSAFYLLGLLVSSLTRRSGTSLLALLLAWLVLVFGVGNVAGAEAKATTHVTSDADVLRQFQAINDEQQGKISEIQDQMFAAAQATKGNRNASAAAQAQIQQLQGQLSAAFDEASEQRSAVLRASERELDGQLSAAESLAAVSPAEAFRDLATGLARTDYWTFKHAREAAEQYAHDADAARRAWDEEHNVSSSGFFISVAADDGGDSAPRFNGPSEEFVPPEFSYRAQDAAAQLASGPTLRDVGVLLAYNVGAFAGAWTAFRRYDVR